MSLISVLFFVIVVGVLLWFVEAYLPMSPPLKTLLRVIVVLVILIWLAQVLLGVRLPRLG